MVLIYSEKDSPRLRYASRIIFTDILGVEVHYTTNLEEYISSSALKINYSGTSLGSGIHFKPAEILFESDIQNQIITVDNWNDLPVFFIQENVLPFPFDPLAMTFYLASRYEEYIPGERDRHGRFIPEYSLAGQNAFLDKPLINILALKIKEQLLIHHPEFKFPQQQYKFIPSVDIDQAFAHKGKGLIRSLGGLAKLLFKLNFKEGIEKLRVLSGMQDDPFDNFDLQLNIFNEYNLHPLYFVLIGDYGAYDKNSSYRNTRFRKLLKKLSTRAELGIHPSYGSSKDPDKIHAEVKRLSTIISKPVVISRQHFLMLDLPASYSRLMNQDIQGEYSMGYASGLGFRASISSPFNAYDLVQDKELPIRIHPFAFMDSALSDYMQVLPEDYIKFVRPLIQSVKQVNGELIGIWHNYALSDDEAKHHAFIEIIKEAVQ